MDLHSFLTNLAKDTAARSKYQDDPVGTMKAAGLSESQIIAVLSQDPSKIQQELGGDAGMEKFSVNVITTVLVFAR